MYHQAPLKSRQRERRSTTQSRACDGSLGSARPVSCYRQHKATPSTEVGGVSSGALTGAQTQYPTLCKGGGTQKITQGVFGSDSAGYALPGDNHSEAMDVDTLSSEYGDAVPLSGDVVMTRCIEISGGKVAVFSYKDQPNTPAFILKPINGTAFNLGVESFSKDVEGVAGLKIANYRFVKADAPQHGYWANVSGAHGGFEKMNYLIGCCVTAPPENNAGHALHPEQVVKAKHISSAGGGVVVFSYANQADTYACVLKAIDSNQSNSQWELFPDKVLSAVGIKTANYRLVKANTQEHGGWVKISEAHGNIAKMDFFIGDYVEGSNLAQWHNQNITDENLQKVFTQLGALSFMDIVLNNNDRFPIVSGFVNPGNVMISKDGDVVAIDHRSYNSHSPRVPKVFSRRHENIVEEMKNRMNFNAILNMPSFKGKLSGNIQEQCRKYYEHGFVAAINTLENNLDRIESATQAVNNKPDAPFCNQNPQDDMGSYSLNENQLIRQLLTQAKQGFQQHFGSSQKLPRGYGRG